MYRILTGLCCAVWCAVIAVEAFGLNKRHEMTLDSFEMASCFNDEFTDDVTAQIRLYGTGPALTSEEEITEYLEGAAAVCQIYSGYGIIKKKETYGCIWELEGANEDFSWSLQYLRKNNEEDTNENQTAIKNDNMCEGLISWRFAGDWSEKMQNMEEIYLENRYWVYGSFLRKTGAVEIAEDLSQTLWLHFFQNYENLNLPNEKVVRAYLRSMILHAVADYWRSMQKAEDLMRELEILLEENDTGQGAVHEEAFPEEEMDDIAMIYKELSEEERILLSLKYEGRYNSREIGAVIGISPSLVRMRLSRINEKLRNQMKKRNE